MLRTGDEYRESIRDGREVYINGEKVTDVPTHPAFKPIVDARARIYDMAHEERYRDVMSYAPASNAPGGGNEIVEIFDFVSLGEWVGIFRSNWLDDWLGDWLGDLPGNLLFSANSDGDVFVIFFYTTLFTSVWVWLFMLGGVLWPLFTWLRGVLRVDKFPVGSAMAIGGVFGGLVVTALGYVRMAVLS